MPSLVEGRSKVLMSETEDLVRADPRWARLERREATDDFLYSVATTGIYCRPDCPSRRPNPRNVQFYDTAQAAERAGFRACLRCRPDRARETDARTEMVARLCQYIEAADEPPSLEALATYAGLSPHHVQRSFKAVTGLTPKAYAEGRRAERVREALRSGPSVTEAYHAAGFGSSGRFYASAEHILGMSPSNYRAGGADQVIRFAVGETSLGALLVAATERGVCAVSLGDAPERLVEELQERFPSAELLGAEEGFEGWVAQVVAFVEEPRASLELPLDLRGTAFQRRVWRALRDIPVGRTLSYAELAARIDAPRATRAVASACARNPVALAIPCHRVVRSDGGLGGYRWGVERKRALLERERSH